MSDADYRAYVAANSATFAENSALEARYLDAQRDPSKWADFETAANARNRARGVGHLTVRKGSSLAADPHRASVQQTGGVTTAAIAATATLTSNFISVSQEPEIYNNYCGPATAVMMARAIGNTKSSLDSAPLAQANIAGYLQTGAPGGAGTPAGGLAGGLNDWIWGHGVPGGYAYIGATTSSSSQMLSRVKLDTDIGWSVGLNTVELSLATSWRYNNHPNQGKKIFHFIATYGYINSTIYFADPSAGSLGLPAFSAASPYAGDTRMWNFVNQSGSDSRGYTW